MANESTFDLGHCDHLADDSGFDMVVWLGPKRGVCLCKMCSDALRWQVLSGIVADVGREMGKALTVARWNDAPR